MGTKIQFLELDNPLQPDAYDGTVFCQGCGGSMSVYDQAPCDHCHVVLCSGCVEWQGGWHCEDEMWWHGEQMLRLANALALAAHPDWCCIAGHGRLKTSRRTFERSVDNVRPWDGADMLLGECSRCHSTLAFDLGGAREVAA